MKLGLLVAFLLFCAIPAFAAPSSDDAVSAAKTWLGLVDGKNYPESWKGAADLFQQGVSEAKWDGMVQGVRDKMGPLKSREFQDVKLTKTLPGVPDGDYAVVTFKSSFEQKPDAVELIALILENGQWKAGGYYIH